MESLVIEPYLQTPEISFDATSGEMLLTGKSYPADAREFYRPIIEWVREYAKSPAPKTTFTCEIEYLNSASQKQLVELLIACKRIHDEGNDFIVHWIYEEGDDDIQSVGELIENELEIPFTYQET